MIFSANDFEKTLWWTRPLSHGLPSVPDVNNRADRPEQVAAPYTTDHPARCCTHFSLTVCIYVINILSIYCVYICNILYFHGYIFIISKNVYCTFLGLIFLAVIQLCILYTHIVFSNKSLPMYYFKRHTCSSCESLPGGEGESRHGLAAPVSGVCPNLKGSAELGTSEAGVRLEASRPALCPAWSHS